MLAPRLIRVLNNNYRCAACHRSPAYHAEADVLVCPVLANYCCRMGILAYPYDCPLHPMTMEERSKHFYLTPDRAWFHGLPFPRLNRPFLECN